MYVYCYCVKESSQYVMIGQVTYMHDHKILPVIVPIECAIDMSGLVEV